MISIQSGLYKYDQARHVLLQTVTQQHLHLLNDTGISRNFQYEDLEINFGFTAQKIGNSFLVEFRSVDGTPPLSYGLWRRLVFFLIDALSVWNYMHQSKGEHFYRTDFKGGWNNGVWKDEAILQAVLVNTSSADLSQDSFNVTRDRSQRLFPLDATPQEWAYSKGQAPEGETALTLDDITPIKTQLTGLPYFFRRDLRSFIFMRYVETNFHRGEDYSPTPYYGYVHEGSAFTMRAHSVYGVDSFADWMPHSTLNADDPIWPKDYKGNNVDAGTFDLSIPLKEELIFALFDINGLAIPFSERPMIKERDDDLFRYYFAKSPKDFPPERGVRFGDHLQIVWDLPVCRNLGMTSIAFGRYGPPLVRSDSTISASTVQKKSWWKFLKE